MKIRRDIGSIPLRSAADTWGTIIAMVRSRDSVDFAQLQAAAPVLQSLITDEIHGGAPFTFAGVGPRLVIYLLFGMSALEVGTRVDDLDWVPTAGDWRLYVPCDAAQLSWAREALAEKAPRVVVHDRETSPADSEGSAA